jgi:hypothetical protein
VYTTGSFDPNDIIVNKTVLTTTELSTAPWLEYIIRFQNTGNDTAFTVKILNPIDTNKLDISSIEFVNASHPVNINWINYQRNMEFKFENILLPDSNTNEPLSHGFRSLSHSTQNNTQRRREYSQLRRHLLRLQRAGHHQHRQNHHRSPHRTR